MLWDDVVYVSLLLISIAIGPLYRAVQEPHVKQWFATLFGIALVICVSGWSVLHPLITVLVNAIIITSLSWKKCHLVSLFFSFFYLLVIFRLGDYFGLPSPPTHTNLVVMILTLKLPGLAFEINNAATASNDDIQGINSEALKSISFMDVIHYSFGYMGVLTGPYYRYRTYWDSLHRPFSKHVDPWPLTYYKLKQIATYITIFLTVNHLFPSDYTQTLEFEEHCFIYRFFYMYPAFAGFRLRMFIGMALAECVCQMSGLGAYPVCCQPVPGLGPRDYKVIEKLSMDDEKMKDTEQDFETVHNMNVWEVETSPLVKQTMKMWNTCIQYWMAICIYKRFPHKGLRTMVTLTLSALWHGYAAGYYFCICQVPLYLFFEDISVRFYNQCDPNGFGRKAWGFFLWWAKLTCMAYLGVPFQLLHFYKIIHFYKSLYFSGHILGLVLYLFVRILKIYFLKRRQDKDDKNK
ncbi:lysophospholipid acyltransferase 7 [Harpegnathos saltator]|uniref:Lysophospholipid acyltransferase 7 n=1 Tax=Harpegnathos saltator TaxID=610380 RepID=E2BZP9_HARSA|nr:lysophospholipid acyltransferase 7 [Harpegnathos saltator]EFN78811.1 Membrane-bound O-acyltransferase domain-containing protein 7 [Harpegnathos saltator]